MKGMAKGLLVAIIISIVFMVVTNLVMFFPWYMTLVVETFNVSQVTATDNYLKETYHDDSLDRLRALPIFKDKKDNIKITAINSSTLNAVGKDDEKQYYGLSTAPYRQRGKAITVKIEATYPLTVTLWSIKIQKDLDVSFTIKTNGLKHYKDLVY